MIAAVLLAAGEARRMGRPKLTLPWSTGGTVVAHAAGLYREAGVQPIVVVTGGHRRQIEAALGGAAVVCVHNPDYRRGGMLSSIRAGLTHLQTGAAEAALLAPADLPMLRVETIRTMLERRPHSAADLVVPSYRMRRGHPVLIGRALWKDLLETSGFNSLREFLRQRAEHIEYVAVDDVGVIQDVDTTDDFAQATTAPANET